MSHSFHVLLTRHARGVVGGGCRRGRLLVFLGVSVVAFAGFCASAWAAPMTYTVTTTADSGVGSLRQAITASNGNSPGAGQSNTIDFGIGAVGSRQTIEVLSALPTITEPVALDGASQGSSQPLIDLDGGSAGNVAGLVISAGSTTVSTLAITNFSSQDGIALEGGSGDVVEGDDIGTDGTVADGNFVGVLLTNGTSDATIGGTSAGSANVISGNDVGVYIDECSGNTVEGDLVGTNAAGTAAIGNSETGVELVNGAADNTIGGTSTSSGDVISGNGGDGVDIEGLDTDGNLVEGDLIGTGKTGASALGNAEIGVSISFSASGNTIGGAAADAGDVISANGGDGIEVASNATTGNTVEGDSIGTNAAGTDALANAQDGVYLTDESSNTTIGGTSAGTVNVISGNADDGVDIDNSTDNAVTGNLIGTDAAGTGALANGGDGVELIVDATGNAIGGASAAAGNTIAHNGGNGVRVDSGDGASSGAIVSNVLFANGTPGIALTNGGNAGEAAPTITSVTTNGSSATVSGTVSAGTHLVQVFGNDGCADPEGAQLLGSVTTAGTTWTASVPAVTLGEGLTATSTDTAASQTSQFSACEERQTIQFTSPAPSAAVYGGTYTPTATATSGLAVSFSIDSASTPGTCAAVAGTVSFTGAGSCVVDANQGGGTGFLPAPAVQQSFTVAKAVVHVDANPATKTLGGTDPPATGTLRTVDFVHGDSAGVVSGAPQCAIGPHSETVGTYPGDVTCAVGTLSAANYTFAVGNAAAFTISQPPPPTPPSTTPSAPQPAPPSNAFTFGKATVAPGGKITLPVNAPDAGRFTATATFTVRSTVVTHKHGKRVTKHVTKTYTYGTGNVRSTRQGTFKLGFALSRSAARELKALGSRQVTCAVTFIPTGGKASAKSKQLTIKRSAKGKFS
jgi:hypothetical protein